MLEKKATKKQFKTEMIKNDCVTSVFEMMEMENKSINSMLEVQKRDSSVTVVA